MGRPKTYRAIAKRPPKDLGERWKAHLDDPESYPIKFEADHVRFKMLTQISEYMLSMDSPVGSHECYKYMQEEWGDKMLAMRQFYKYCKIAESVVGPMLKPNADFAKGLAAAMALKSYNAAVAKNDIKLQIKATEAYVKARGVDTDPDIPVFKNMGTTLNVLVVNINGQSFHLLEKDLALLSDEAKALIQNSDIPSAEDIDFEEVLDEAE